MEANLNQNQVVTHYIIGRFQQLGGGRKDGINKASFNVEERSHHLA
jgi:hypothetical protein